MIIINIGHKCECLGHIGTNRKTTSGTWTIRGRKKSTLRVIVLGAKMRFDRRR
jgi:hypothetical protein